MGTIGANGRNSSRCLMSRLSRSRISTRMRRGQDAAVPERARTELGRAIHPSDDAAGGEIVGDALDERGVVELVDVLTVLARRARELLRRRPPDPRTDDRAPRDPGCRSRCDRRRAPRRVRSPHRPARMARTRGRSRTQRGCARWPRHSAPRRPQNTNRAGRFRDWSCAAMSTSVSSSTRCTLAAHSAKRRPSDGLEIDRIVGMPRRPEQIDELRANTTDRPSSETRRTQARARTRRLASGG